MTDQYSGILKKILEGKQAKKKCEAGKQRLRDERLTPICKLAEILTSMSIESHVCRSLSARRATICAWRFFVTACAYTNNFVSFCQMSLPTVAIVGRPNVGKSTIFNRLVGAKLAIVSEIPGTTRDRSLATVTLDKRGCLLIDTAGVLPPKSTETLKQETLEQIDLAKEAADVLLFVVDAKEGITVADEQIARALHRQTKPVLFAANKTSRNLDAKFLAESRRLGFDEPVLLCATEGRGFTELETRLADMLPAGEPEQAKEGVVKVAILGRPNVGKSTLLNALVEDKRAIVSATPGTTRDPVNARLTLAGRIFEVIDTAGLRRRGFYRVNPKNPSANEIEFYSSLRAVKSLETADLAILLLDAERGLADGDQHIAGLITEARTGAIIAVNKWDARNNPDEKSAMREWLGMMQKKLAFLNYAPVVFLSAEQGENLRPLKKQLSAIMAEQPEKLSSHYVDKIVAEAADHHPAFPPYLRLKQDKNRPNRFEIIARETPHRSIRRYLENELRDHLTWTGWPIIVESLANK